ncbi:MAG: alpha-L-fucosidase [Bacteroidales bacterium]
MRKLYPLLLMVLFISIVKTAASQTKKSEYIAPTEPEVLQKMEWWHDIKFGLLMHWGAYSQWGVVESWSICPEDEGWCGRKIPDYNEYVRRYEGLKYSFNPIHFNPEKWAAAAKDAGMRYVVFTTKHHDGFCMFDTKQTDYKITDKECPFYKNPKADVTKEIFNAFRKQNFGIGAYFSKPDWHSDDYWNPNFPPIDRNVNYETSKYPEKWKRFQQFTFNQIEELTLNYGKVDILWFDGGWVRSLAEQTEESRTWLKHKAVDQDINMPAINAMARKNQPGILMVDRSVHNKFENYFTPEQQIPEKPLPYPWETCMTMANSWSWVYNDTYKPTHKLIHLLVDIVAKGGNFLLNIGPDPSGQLDDTAYVRLKEIGEWMKINNEAIYNTRPLAPYKDGKTCFTQGKNGEIYLIYLADVNESMPSEITIHNYQPKANAKVKLLGTDALISTVIGKNFITLKISGKDSLKPPCNYAWVFKVD